MNTSSKESLRAFIADLLARHGDHGKFEDSESLFLSGRLDSFSMMQLVMHLEETHGMDFSNVNFDVSLIDTVTSIIQFVESPEVR